MEQPCAPSTLRINLEPTRSGATVKEVAVVLIDEADNSEKWICKVRGNTRNIPLRFFFGAPYVC